MTLEEAFPSVASSRFPKWLPPVVAAVAERYWDSLAADRELVLRLATDDRMRSVWRELDRRKPATGKGALGLFFVYAYTYAGTPTKALPVSELTALQEACKHQAALLRTSADWLLKVEEISILLDPPFSVAFASAFTAERPVWPTIRMCAHHPPTATGGRPRPGVHALWKGAWNTQHPPPLSPPGGRDAGYGCPTALETASSPARQRGGNVGMNGGKRPMHGVPALYIQVNRPDIGGRVVRQAIRLIAVSFGDKGLNYFN
jgi:hypothetical protein